MKNKKNIIFVIILAAMAKGIGLLRDIVITHQIGFNYITDAIFVVLPLILLLFSVFNTVIKTAFRPLFAAKYLEEPMKAIHEFKIIRNSMVIILSIIILFIFLFPGLIINLLVPGLDSQSKVVSISLLQYSIISLIFIGLANIYNGFLQSMQVYGSEQFVSLINNTIFIIILFVMYDSYGISAVAIAIIIGSVMQYIYMKIRFELKTVKSEKNLKIDLKSLSHFFIENRLIIYGGTISQLTVIIDKFCASFFEVGSISALHYANILKNLPITIVLMIVTNIYFTNLSIDFKKDKERFYKSVVKQSEMLLIFIIPVVIFFIVNAEYIVDILFNRGDFDPTGVVMISNALIAYTFVLLFWSFKEVFTKAFYAANNRLIPFLISINSLLLNFILNLILGYYLSYIGIALATSISTLVNGILIAVLFNIKIKRIICKAQFVFIIKIFTIGIIIFLIINYFNSILDFRIYINLILNSFILFLTYGISILAFKINKGSVKN
ncbi:murein biosynthesis integral membrane protein MurJ [Salinicoccus sp. HZC-1]|uniref:murein biosynthesis integral membrane protein MurJ n=1 Tax=Salinicoccus sp. HZC-1 TaxID=3385497 RepID=UPI00398B8AD0